MDYPSDLDLDAACGRIIREWAMLESTLCHLYLAFLQAPDQFRARITWASLPNLQARRKVLNRLAENYLPEDEVRCFRILMKRMSRLANKRNMIAHARCLREGKHIRFLEFDTEGEDGTFLFLEQTTEPFNNVKGWASAINKLQDDLLGALVDILPRQHTSSKMHRELQGDRDRNSVQNREESMLSEPEPPPRS